RFGLTQNGRPWQCRPSGSALEAYAERLRRTPDRPTVRIEARRVLLSHGALARFAREAVSGVLNDGDALRRPVGANVDLNRHESLIDLVRVGFAGEGAVVPVGRAEEPGWTRLVFGSCRRRGRAGAGWSPRRHGGWIVDGLLARAVGGRGAARIRAARS